MHSSQLVPAPWNLSGDGFIMLYRFKREFLASQPALGTAPIQDFAGGLGAVMLVDYHSSNVGPYQELLFIPGKFLVRNKKWHTISQIYVSTDASVIKL